MNATELFAPIKTASTDRAQPAALKAETVEVRDLQTSELLFVGGGDLFAGTR
ncbi:MAG: hypothetical protein ACRDAM_20645 [Casimicrobium sp.]